MMGRHIHYSEPVEFHKALPGAKSIVIWKRVDDDGYTPAVATTAKPKNPTKPKSRLARNVAIDDEIGEPSEAKKGITMTDYDYDTSRGPWHAMIDRQALARQAQTGETYQKAYTECYCDPRNASIVNELKYEHLAKSHDVMFGTQLSSIPVAKAAPAYDPLRKAAELAEHLGPAHAKLHSLAVDHQRAHGGMSYQQAYSHLYAKPENVGLRNAIKAEHMQATMSGLGQGVDKAAPMDPPQDYAHGEANQELHELVVTRMKREPNLSYERAFVREYLAPANRSLKQRYDAESDAHMRRLAPVPAFPPYGHPGDRAYPNPPGRERPRGSVGG
jgi:hypothetical protein